MNNHKEEIKKTYDKIASKYSAGHFDHFWVEEFETYKKFIDGKKVIDIGCGAGRDASVFVKEGFDYTGIDASEGMLKVAKERVPKGIFKQMDFYNIGFPDNNFDGFWAAASLLHIPKKDLKMVLVEISRITKQGGIGFISIKERTDMDEGLIEENKYGGIARYFSFYEKDEFKQLLEDNGLKVLKITEHIENDERKTNWLCYFVENKF